MKPDDNISTVSVRILDKEYQVSAPAEEVDELTKSARVLDERMGTIRDSGKVFGADRIAVMAGLNLSHELLKVQGSAGDSLDVVEKRTSGLVKRISEALDAHKQLSL